MGLENALLAAALLLLANHRWYSGRVRYLLALALLGLIPLIKLSGAVLAVAVIAGLIADNLFQRRRDVSESILLALLVPIGAASCTTLAFMKTSDVPAYLEVGFELVKGYSIAMSRPGPPLEVAGAFLVLMCILLVWCSQWGQFQSVAQFNFLVLSLPLAIALKHGFIRNDVHTVNFFCFAAFSLGLTFLRIPLKGPHARIALLGVLGIAITWQQVLIPTIGPYTALSMASGYRSLAFAALMLSGRKNVEDHLSSMSARYYDEARLETALLDSVGDSEVASLSITYNTAAMDGLNLKLYPIIQRYSAYTPYLDGLNATWIAREGPRFLLFDGETIDQRHLFGESPATWLEVYRWYDLRQNGSRSILLERRALPRFKSLKSLKRARGDLRIPFVLPQSQEPLFLSMKCRLSSIGKLKNLLLGASELRMVSHVGGMAHTARIIPPVLIAPAVINFAPRTLAELGELFRDDSARSLESAVEKVTFEGPGLEDYETSCEFELFRTEEVPFPRNQAPPPLQEHSSNP